jgi:hypothetical protein
VRYPAQGGDLKPAQRWKHAEICEVLEVLPSQFLVRDLDGEMQLLPHALLDKSRIYANKWELAHHYVERPDDDPFTDKLDELKDFAHASWVAAIMHEIESWMESPQLELHCLGLADVLTAHAQALRPLESLGRIEYLVENSFGGELDLDAVALKGYHAWHRAMSRRRNPVKE